MTFHTIFSNPCTTSHNQAMTNCEMLWHTMRLSYSSHNFDIEIVTIVKYLKSLLCHNMEKIATFETTQFLNTADDELICGQWN